MKKVRKRALETHKAKSLFQDHCEATRLKKYPDPEPNGAMVDEVIRLVSEDSPACKEINFNNIQVREIPEV